MADRVTVRVVDGAFGVAGDRYTTGETLEVRAAVAKRHPNTLEIVDEAPDAEEDDEEAGSYDHLDVGDADGETEYVVDPDPSELTVEELRERVSGVDTIGLLKAIREAEEDGEDRTTAKEAISARIEELEK